MGVYKMYVLVAAFLAVTASQLAAEACPGCPQQQDPADFPMQKLHRMLSLVNCRNKVVKVYSVTTQVVAGLKYEVVYGSSSGQTCTASWIEAPWISEAPLEAKLACEAARTKRSLLGGYEDVKDSELPTIKGLGEVAVNQGTNGNRKVVVSVLKAQKKIVNGWVYKVEFLVKTTACSFNQVPDENCSGQEVAPRQICNSLLYLSPYLQHGAPHSEVMSLECQDAGEKYAVEHMKHKRSTDETLSPETVELARKQIGYLFDGRSNSLFTQEVTKMDITHAERYGHGYKIDATVNVAYTNCTKAGPYQPGKICTPSTQLQDQQTCDVTFIMVQPQGGRKWYRLDKAECN